MIEDKLDRMIELLEIISGSPAINTDGPEILNTPITPPPSTGPDLPADTMGGSVPKHSGTFIAPPPDDTAPPAIIPDTHTVPDAGPLDKAGYPWDARIHAGTKTKVMKTGEWKLIKKINETSPGLVAQVRAEWDARKAGQLSASAVDQSATINPPPATGTTGPPPTNEGPTLAKFVLALGAAGYDATGVAPFLAKHGILALPQLSKQPELIPTIAAEMGIIL